MKFEGFRPQSRSESEREPLSQEETSNPELLNIEVTLAGLQEKVSSLGPIVETHSDDSLIGEVDEDGALILPEGERDDLKEIVSRTQEKREA